MSRRAVLAALATVATSSVVGVTLPGTADAAVTFQLGRIQYDSPGTDTRTNTSLNAEYVVVKNVTSTSRSMYGFTVRDAQSHVYTFGSFTLGGARSVRLHTGRGTNTSTDRYWGSGSYIWNNTGDKAILRNRYGTTLDTCAWTSVGAGYTYC